MENDILTERIMIAFYICCIFAVVLMCGLLIFDLFKDEPHKPTSVCFLYDGLEQTNCYLREISERGK